MSTPSAATKLRRRTKPDDHARSEEAAAYRKLYRTARWRRLRERQLSDAPLCQWCLEREIVEPATEVHHRIPHRGDLELFWSGPFLSTCAPCHASRGQREDIGSIVPGLDDDGWPEWRNGQ
ncbi:HNH endonuclease [Sinorhizobium meliloti]|nr:HNH endonuclease [Sinorhizobium meliloti]